MFSDVVCLPTAVFETLSFESKNKLNFAFSNCLQKNLNWNQLSLARAEKASCVQTLACLNTFILSQNHLNTFQKHIPTVFCSFDSLICSTEDKHFIKHVSSHKIKTRLNFILWLTDRQMAQNCGIFPLPLIDSLWSSNKRQKRRNHGDVFVWMWMKGKTTLGKIAFNGNSN